MTRAPTAQAIGDEIRALRRTLGLTLTELAAAANCSVGLLSQVERGISTPSPQRLHRIAAALGVEADWFAGGGIAADPIEGEFIVRADRRRRLSKIAGITDDLISPHLRGALELLIVRFAPGAGSADRPYSHAGEEAGLVLEGELELSLDGRIFHLDVGDSFAFPSSLQHKYRNTGCTIAVVVWVVTPPRY